MGFIMSVPLIELKDVTKRFVKTLDLAEKIANLLGAHIREEVVQAVDRVNLRIGIGEVLGLVGESGCGKSTIGRIVAGTLSHSDGTVLYRGREVARMSPAEGKQVALKVQMIFQDPLASLNPRMRVRDIIGEAPRVHGLVAASEIEDYLDEIMLRVGLDPSYKRRYPHQFSGGQRQRIGIARALAVQPEFIVCDEAVAALDVSIQAQVLNVFMKLREELELTYLFISHDIGVVEHLADRVAIMYLGRIVELAPTEDLFTRPNHPYTQALLREVPRLDTRQHAFEPIKGEIPSPLDPPSGCHFHPRCPHVFKPCREEQPKLMEIAPEWLSACYLNNGSRR
ncbi:MAG: ABC transporter ATP-binding protein [Desulfobacterales bacterium]|nr:MAG: ABC transporter ATP-binding protein [Desulfobacterales bacterium]